MIMNIPKQDRAFRTRQTILLTAASIFDEKGYQGTSIADILDRAAVTKGALYFHFASKEALAQAVIEAQSNQMTTAEHDLALQSLVDLTLQVAQRLKHDSLLRASIRLTIEQGSFQPIDPAPYLGWIQLSSGLLKKAAAQGELLPHVDVERTAELVIGCFTGLQLLSQVLTARTDFVDRVKSLWTTILPGIAASGVLLRLHVEAAE
jgi:AcrR family transcriptional regulator